MKIWIKWIAIICLIPVVLVLLLSILLYIPPFQNFVVKEVAKKAAAATGMQIQVEHVRLSFPLNLTVRNVQVVSAPDTLLTLGSLTVGVRLLPLLKKDVQVDAIEVKQVRMNTGPLLEGMEIKGVLGEFHAKADHINLATREAELDGVDLSDTAITLFMTDTTEKKDTAASTPVNWLFDIHKIDLKKVAFALQMPADSLRLSAFIDRANLSEGRVDLGTSRYEAKRFTLARSMLRYDGNDRERTPGLDPSHIDLTDLNISLSSLLYGGRDITAKIEEFSTREQSGLDIRSLTGEVESDSITIKVPRLSLRTFDSEIDLEADVPWNALDAKPNQELTAEITAVLGKKDLMILAGALPETFRSAYPDQALSLNMHAEGNLSSIRLRQLNGVLPGALELEASGSAQSLTDSLKRAGNLDFTVRTGDLDFLLSILPESEQERIRIPHGMRLTGNASLKEQTYEAALLLTEGKGKVSAEGSFNPVTESYAAVLKVDSLNPVDFLPKDSLYALTAEVKAEGKGFDPFVASTRARVSGAIRDIRYGSSEISEVTLDGSIEKNLVKFDLLSKYPLAKMDLSLNATLHPKQVQGMLIADVENFDLYGMHLMKDSLSTSFQLFAEAKSDLGKNNRLDVTLGNWELVNPTGHYRPKTLTLQAYSTPDTTRVSFHAGDLGMVLTGNSDLETLTDKFTKITDDVQLQLERDSMLNIPALRPLLPDMHLAVNAGKDNPVYSMLQQANISFSHLDLDASTSPETGFRMDGGVYTLMRDTSRLDTLRLAVRQDSLGLLYSVEAVKTPYRRQSPFTASLKGKVRNTFADAEMRYTDGQGQTGILLGLRADKEREGVRVRLFPDNPILAFRKFELNPDNYVWYKSMKDIEANLRLTGDKNASLWIHSMPEGGKMEEIHAELNQIDLDAISSGFPKIPSMRGMLSADLQYAPSDSSFLIVADTHIDSLYYEQERVGEIMLNGVYLPLSKKDHQVDVHLFRDRNEVAAATALYKTGKKDEIDGHVSLTDLPLDMVNPFIPEDMAKLSGWLQGDMAVQGTPAAPGIEGFLRLDSSAVFVGMVGSSFRFDNKKIEVKDNLITFDRYMIYAAGTNPFVIDGNIDIHDPARMIADLELDADNMQVLNVKRNNESLVYGKLLVNLSSTVKGPFEALKMRGNIRLLGGTDVTYVMKDSPLTAHDRLSDLVTFTSFADTFNMRPRNHENPLPLGGMDMLMTIQIDQAVRANVDLTPDQSSRVQVEGGGDLSFQYTPQGDMFLNGRYTLSGGTVNYSVPIIPLKEFDIQEGSYVQWNGNPMDPTLNLTATERMRASVTLSGQATRLVNFDVGIVIQQTLNDLQLQFTLSAPEDMAVQNELTQMGPEERSKQAVALMVTGMYLAGGSSGNKVNMNMGSALNSFLQSEINNIAGSALKTVDITLGVDKYDDNGADGGGERTDYSFRFAKRFYNDRIRVIIGGRLSTGEGVNNGQAQPFIDNISVEYRLDGTGTRYIKLFHDKNYESLLEGEVTETGAGIVLRKKMRYLKELFIFRKNKTKPVKEEKDEKK